jgi:hypothetical protein
MAILLRLSLRCYSTLLGRCGLGSREYAVLRNGVIRHNEARDPSSDSVEILCQREHADLLLNMASKFCPDFRSEVESAIATANEQ